MTIVTTIALTADDNICLTMSISKGRYKGVCVWNSLLQPVGNLDAHSLGTHIGR